MKNSSASASSARPSGVGFLAIVNLVAFVVTIAFWALVFFGRLVPLPGTLTVPAERANAAVTYGFLIGDVVYSAPLLVLAGVGLWRLRTWGWLAAQMANILWVYSMTVVLLRDYYTAWSPGGLLFIPFALVAAGAIPYLWARRRAFGISG
jgi:hypothetical protein